jgi:hypothetical protein
MWSREATEGGGVLAQNRRMAEGFDSPFIAEAGRAREGRMSGWGGGGWPGQHSEECDARAGRQRPEASGGE